MKRSKLYTAYIPDMQHFKCSLDHSETVDINNIPLILSLLNMGKNSRSRILLELLLRKNTRKTALLVTKLFNNQFAFLDRD